MAGMLMGGLSGALSQQKEGGKNAENMYSDGTYEDSPAAIRARMTHAQTGLAGLTTANAATEAQGNPILGQLFGQGGLMQRTGDEEQQLATQGYQLTPEDRTAYGQASGDIARQFGQSGNSLSQSLADRGLSNSGVAGATFSGMQGNKDEQLAGMQKQIADSRMKMNMDRLSQTRQFLGQLGGQAENAIQNNYNNEANKQRTIYDQNADYLKGSQGQANEALSQQQQTEHASKLAATVQGVQQGKQEDDSNMKSMASMGGMFSDSRVKKNIKRLRNSQYKEVPTYTYEYTHEAYGPVGKHTGVLAQDLLQVNPKHTAVTATPFGYMVDYSKLERV